MANLLVSVMGAFAEFERALIREQQRERHRTGQAAWCIPWPQESLGGRPCCRAAPPRGAGEQKVTLARDFGISRETLYQ